MSNQHWDNTTSDVKRIPPMKIIIDDTDDYILQVRAAKSALHFWHKSTSSNKRFFAVSFEDGSLYFVRRNKNSVRVYRDEGNK